MNIEDCEVGMELKNCYKGEIPKEDRFGIISEVKEETIKFGYSEDEFNPAYYEPVSKFEIGDEAIVEFLNNSKVKIWGKKYNKVINEYLYAVQGCGWNDFCRESELLPIKKKDELEVGDKFRQKGKGEHEVVGVHYDEEEESKIYVVRLLDGEIKGAIDLVFPETIKEIIYD